MIEYTNHQELMETLDNIEKLLIEIRELIVHKDNQVDFHE